jgi:hypothetical protein
LVGTRNKCRGGTGSQGVTGLGGYGDEPPRVTACHCGTTHAGHGACCLSSSLSTCCEYGRPTLAVLGAVGCPCHWCMFQYGHPATCCVSRPAPWWRQSTNGRFAKSSSWAVPISVTRLCAPDYLAGAVEARTQRWTPFACLSASWVPSLQPQVDQSAIVTVRSMCRHMCSCAIHVPHN